MLDLRIVADGHAIPLFDLPAVLGGVAAAREIADQIDGLIAFLDDLSGDVDVEHNGDELDANGAEDDFIDFGRSGAIDLPGCPVSDPDEPDNEDRCGAGDDEPRSGLGSVRNGRSACSTLAARMTLSRRHGLNGTSAAAACWNSTASD